MSENTISIQESFTAFNKLKVLVIGDVMIDAYMWGGVSRISPEAPVPIVEITKKENRLGGAANVALNIQAMGAEPILCSVIGDDTNGDLFTKLLEEQNIRSSGIEKSNERITTVKTRVIGSNHQMLRIDEEVVDSLSDHATASLLNRIETILDQEDISVIIFEDYDKGSINTSIINKTISLAKAKNIPTVVDPKSKNFLNYKGVTLFKPNLKEMKEGLKIDFDHKQLDELSKVSNTFIQEHHIENLLITLSELGVYVDTTSNQELIPAHIRKISDVSGAGDTVISVAALCLAVGLPVEKVATIANLAGGLVCEKVGVVPIDKQQLLDEAIQLKL